MRQHVLGLVLAGLAGSMIGAGCGAAPLTRDEQVRGLMAENRQLQQQLGACEQKVAALTASGAKPVAAVPAPPEDAWRAVAVRFGKFSGVVGAGGAPSDQRLKIVLEPLDATGDVVKRAGRIDLEAWLLAADGKPQALLHRWSLPEDQLRQTWLSGLGTYAYVMRFPWPGGRRPAADKLLVKAKFTCLDGTVLAADTEIPLAPAVAAPKPEPAKPTAEKAPAK